MPIIEACVDGSEFWANKIRSEFRGKDANQLAFVNNFKALLVELMAYVKEHHTTGLTWNPRGVDAAAYNANEGNRGLRLGLGWVGGAWRQTRECVSGEGC